VQVSLGGDELAEGTSWEIDTTAGVLTFESAPARGAEITAGFEFDVPVRFDTDRIEVSAASFRAGEVPRVPVMEIRI
jgi:uncharacterized protein (TIGR02217 family)